MRPPRPPDSTSWNTEHLRDTQAERQTGGETDRWRRGGGMERDGWNDGDRRRTSGEVGRVSTDGWRDQREIEVDIGLHSLYSPQTLVLSHSSENTPNGSISYG
jgi:hypothetical protein